MEEVRSYWQVASITHFCNLFGKPFKLPTFEPEELEQAFIINVPEPPKTSLIIDNHYNRQNITNPLQTDDNSQHHNGMTHTNSTHASEDPDNNSNHSVGSNNKNNHDDNYNGDELPTKKNGNDDGDNEQSEDEISPKRSSDDPEFQPPSSLLNHYQTFQAEQQQIQQADDQQNLHLLVKLGIALLKPHFNSKLTSLNWENYLRRIIDSIWVELEHHPSPFRMPIITPEGVESTKNLTFNELRLSDKIDVFYALCDYRFWCDDASEAIKDYPIEELRLESVGKDSQGYDYWYFSGTRLFREHRELSQDLMLRKKRIEELEHSFIELEKAQILKEREEKIKAELDKAKQQANEAKEARLAAAKKRQQEQDASNQKRKKERTSILPARTGLRERRSSAASNSNDSQNVGTPTTRSKLARQQQPDQQTPEEVPRPSKATRSSAAKSSRQDGNNKQKAKTPEPPKKSPIEECKEELEKIAIKPTDRAESWCVHCESLEEWESFATKFEKTKSTNEKYLHSYINEEILPKIRAIYAKRAAEARRKEKELIFSLASRRVSTRIISKRAQEEEEERLAQQREAELQKKKAIAEIRLRAELEREMRAKKNRFVVNGGASSTCSEDGTMVNDDNNTRYNLRQQVHYDSCDESNEFDGIIHPDKLSEFYEALELIVDTVKTSKHAWPFVDPVPSTVPGYYDLIEEPMDLKKLRTKVEFREYKSLIELEKDFQLLINNCEKFNGPKNVYTKMVYKLWKTFRKNVRLYLQRDLHMNEYETFIYPPPEPVVQSKVTAPTQNGTVTSSTAFPCTTTEDNSSHKQEPQLNLDDPSCVKQEKAIHNQANGVHLEVPPKGIIMSDSYNVTNLKSDDSNLTDQKPLPDVLMKIDSECHNEPPEPVCEEVIIDSYAVPCPDDIHFIWPQETQTTNQTLDQ